MTVVPTGLPAWVHANDHTTYGGNVNKENYQALDSINGRTDVSAQELVRIAADLAAIQRIAPFAILNFTTNDSAPAVPTINSYLAMAGGQPTGARVSDGRVTFTWDASYDDPYSQSGNIHIVGCEVSVEGTGANYANYNLSDPDVNLLNERVEVVVFDDTGAPIQDATVTLVIHTGQL